MDSPSTSNPAVRATIEDAAGNGPRTSEATTGTPSKRLTQSSSSSEKLTSLTTTTLQFLANASSEKLGACAIGLCASTYLILGRVGLVLIGAVGGVVLHATWESSGDERGGPQNSIHPSLSKRREVGLEVAKRVLDWRDENKPAGNEDAQVEEAQSEGLTAPRRLDLSGFKSETGAALTNLVDAIIRDYVQCVLSQALSALAY
jgi:hypothetical protein